MKMKKILCSALVFLMMLSMLVGCGSSGDAASGEGELPVLRVASQSSLHSLPNYYIVENGLDEEAGFKIETTYFSAGAAENEALAAGLWDIGSMGTVPAATSVANYDAKIIFEVCACEAGTQILCRPDSDIAKATGYSADYPDMLGNPDAVKGITVLGPIGTCGHQLMLAWLQSLGLTEADVELVHMDYASAYQAFAAGEGDILLSCPPILYNAKAEGFVEVTNAKAMGVTDSIPYIASAAAYEDEEMREVMVKFLKLVLEVNEKFAADPELTAEWVDKFWTEQGVEVDPKYIADDIALTPYMTSETLAEATIGASVTSAAEFQVELGQMEEDKLSKFDTNCTNEILELVLAD